MLPLEEGVLCYVLCPLCARNADTIPLLLGHRILSSKQEHASLVTEQPEWLAGVFPSVKLGYGKLLVNRPQPTHKFASVLWLLHQRCLHFLPPLKFPALHLLVQLVEPTFFPLILPSSITDKHGAFYSPRALQTILPSKASEQSAAPEEGIPELLLNLPPEIWNMIYKYDIGRLIFLMKASLHLGSLELDTHFLRERRFTMKKLNLKGDFIRIHRIHAAGRTYLHSLSDPSIDPVPKPEILSTFSIQSRDYKLNGSTYLAIKSDDIGIVDIAFEHTNNEPHWILYNSASPFPSATSKIRYANVYNLTLYSDMFKCRAIIPSNRNGPEPFFFDDPLPPPNSWVDSGYLVQSELTDPRNFSVSSAYMSKATYIPFEGMKHITFDFQPSRRGILGLHVNLPTIYQEDSIVFPECPTRFDMGGHWEPPVPHRAKIMRESVVDNALGIWWGTTFPYFPIHIGVVVSQKEDLKNTDAFEY
ncbi:hypothetical protein FQN57_005624 [Myotisia sp. PD_48]|nr:hypothetical protein FQN57_005624 [Myotisia sp. PD_48]